MLTLLAAMALGAIVALLAARISLGLSRSMFDSYLQTARTLVEQSASDARTAGTVAELTRTVEKLDVSFGKLYMTVVTSPSLTGTTPGRPMAQQYGEGPPAPTVQRNPFPPMPPLPQPGSLVDRLPDPPGTKAPSVGEQARARAFAEPT